VGAGHLVKGDDTEDAQCQEGSQDCRHVTAGSQCGPEVAVEPVEERGYSGVPAPMPSRYHRKSARSAARALRPACSKSSQHSGSVMFGSVGSPWLMAVIQREVPVKVLRVWARDLGQPGPSSVLPAIMVRLARSWRSSCWPSMIQAGCDGSVYPPVGRARNQRRLRADLRRRFRYRPVYPLAGRQHQRGRPRARARYHSANPGRQHLRQLARRN